MKRRNLGLFILITLSLFSCKQNERRTEAEKIVTKWIGKEIQFPEDVQCCILGKDTTTNLCADLFDREYNFYYMSIRQDAAVVG
jgi:hypothetical protein